MSKPQYVESLEKLDNRYRHALSNGDWDGKWVQLIIIQNIDDEKQLYKFYESNQTPVPPGFKRVTVYYDDYGFGRPVHQANGNLVNELMCQRHYVSAKAAGEL